MDERMSGMDEIRRLGMTGEEALRRVAEGAAVIRAALEQAPASVREAILGTKSDRRG